MGSGRGVVLSSRRRLLSFLALMVTLDFSIRWLEPQIGNVADVGGFVAELVLTLLFSGGGLVDRPGSD